MYTMLFCNGFTYNISKMQHCATAEPVHAVQQVQQVVMRLTTVPSNKLQHCWRLLNTIKHWWTLLNTAVPSNRLQQSAVRYVFWEKYSPLMQCRPQINIKSRAASAEWLLNTMLCFESQHFEAQSKYICKCMQNIFANICKIILCTTAYFRFSAELNFF